MSSNQKRQQRTAALDAVRRALNDLPPDMLTAQTALAAEHALNAAITEIVRALRAEPGARPNGPYFIAARFIEEELGGPS